MNLLFYISFPARIQSTVTERALKHRLIPVQNEQARTDLAFFPVHQKAIRSDAQTATITVDAGSVGYRPRSITVRSCSQAVYRPPNKPARKPRPHQRNGLGQKMWPWKQEECDLVKKCLAARKLSASRVPVLASASSNWHRFEGRSGLELEAWNSWFNVAARCTGARRLSVSCRSCCSGTAGNGVAWPCPSQGEKKRKAGEGVREKRTDQCQAGRFVSLVSSSATHEKSGAFGIYIYSNKMCKR